MTEQYVLQQLVYLRTRNLYMAGPSYWTGVKSEVDFVVQINNEVIPIEVKSAWNLRAKSLRVYLDKYHPAHAIRTSLTEFRTGEDITEIPLYAILHLAITLPFRT
jgi:predicted AAA+ superfamily ATPase